MNLKNTDEDIAELIKIHNSGSSSDDLKRRSLKKISSMESTLGQWRKIQGSVEAGSGLHNLASRQVNELSRWHDDWI